MMCPKCKCPDSIVLESRCRSKKEVDPSTIKYDRITRRRKCTSCFYKFTTHEYTKDDLEKVTKLLSKK